MTPHQHGKSHPLFVCNNSKVISVFSFALGVGIGCDGIAVDVVATVGEAVQVGIGVAVGG
jgi:hypothetical protein